MTSSRLHALAVNDEGFAFDPTTGETYQLNRTGLFILQKLKEGQTPEEIARALTETFEVSEEEAYRDVIDFMEHVRMYNLS